MNSGFVGWSTPGLISLPYVNVQDQKAQNTQGGTFTTGAWQTRTLNTVVSDTAGILIGNLASNQVILPFGLYYCEISCPGFNTQGHQARLQNIATAVTLLVGTSEWNFAASNGAATRSVVSGRFSLSGSTALEVQHRSAATFATQGFGIAANVGTPEVYTVAEFWKLA